MRQRKWTDEQLTEAVRISRSCRATIQAIGLKPDQGLKGIRGHIARLGLSTAHWTGQAYAKGTRFSRPDATPLEELLVANAPTSSSFRKNLKRRLLTAGLLENRCYDCPQGPLWNGKRLVYQLDHINGDTGDSRLENLRMLCPNCHSQTLTFSGRNKKRPSSPIAEAAASNTVQ